MVRICIIYDKLRFEEKKIYNDIQQKGFDATLIDGKSLIFDTESSKSDSRFGDIILQRVISYNRGLHLTYCLEQIGLPVVNSFSVSEICGNKLITSLILKKNNVPTPKTTFAFSTESARECMKKIGFPLVVKPIIGSWGRGVYQIKDQSMADMMLDSRQENDNSFSRIYYFQELINRPSRDIRCIVIGDQIVASVFRYSSENEWRTNVAVGGRTEMAPLTSELKELVLKASNAVGGGILGVDLMEDKERGYLVHEVNNTVEFRGASAVCKSDIAGAMTDYLVKMSSK
ncbi:MAG: lysine biosynthesis protein LysX [Nitrososphaeraceae archaeon]|nr:lysine biosynthesis protein LysX [Nitrososphaeraceae archaeon]MDW0155720.1 lysine biosynthesis protein LysX [Nitrososphaeraceae archaeon]